MKCNQSANNKLNWTAGHQKLLVRAQGGNQFAHEALFNGLYDFLKVVHSHTQDGQFPSKFGNTYNFNGRSFEEASSDVYGVYTKCVKDYNASFGVPFGAYLVGELKHRAMDWVRNRSNDRLIHVGQFVSDETRTRLDDAGYEKACSDYYAEISGDCIDEETHPVEYYENQELVQKVFEIIHDTKDETLIKFLDIFYKYGLEKRGAEEVAKRMNVTRTAVYNYLKKVRAAIKPKLGDDFANAA